MDSISKMVDPKHYTYRVIWSKDDNEFVGLCAEFPSMSHLDETQGAALEGITSLVADIVSEMQSNGEAPLPARVASDRPRPRRLLQLAHFRKRTQ